MSELILNMPFPSLNEYINLERSDRYAAANMKKGKTESVCYLAMEQKFKLPVGLYDVDFIWYKPNNRMDHDNIAFGKKFILDGLKMAKVIPDDTPKHIRNFTDVFEIDKTRSYVSCKVIFRLVKETKCPLCEEKMNSFTLTHYKCKECDIDFTD